jgi:hypothetical protein
MAVVLKATEMKVSQGSNPWLSVLTKTSNLVTLGLLMQSPLYYYECHITLDPVDETTLETLKSICESYEFKVAKLYLDSRVKDRLELLDTNAQLLPLDAASQAILAKSFKDVDLGEPNWKRVLLSNFLRAALVQAGTEDLWINLVELTKKLEGQPSNKPNP